MVHSVVRRRVARAVSHFVRFARARRRNGMCYNGLRKKRAMRYEMIFTSRRLDVLAARGARGTLPMQPARASLDRAIPATSAQMSAS
jgi:hypothetical protein